MLFRSIEVTAVTINTPETTTIKQGESFKLNITITPSDATNKSVTWTSSNTSIATVSNDGTVTAVGPGTVTITVTTQDGNFTFSITLTIDPPSTNLESVRKISVWSHSNKIFIDTPHALSLRIYNTVGVMVHNANIPEGNYETSIQKGIYFVILGNERSIKIFVK